MSVLSDFQKFVNDMEASSTYKNWCNTHGVDCAAWQTYRAGLLTRTPPPTAPSMSTSFGQALVDVGVMAVDAGLVVPPPPPPVPPHASFTSSISGLTVTFTDTSTPGDGPITGWAWDFGDGSTSNSQNPTPHTYASGATYPVSLTVTGSGGSTTARASIVVGTTPPISGGCYWGGTIQGNAYGGTNAGYGNAPYPNSASDNTWNLFESHTGKRVTSVGVHLNFATWDPNPFNHARARGAFCLLSMGVEGTSIAAINAGTEDAAIDAWATQVAAYGEPIMFRPWWEFNGNWGYAWQTGAGVTAAQYVSAWQRFKSRCDAKGAVNLSWAWCPNAWGAPHFGGGIADPTPWYPGDAYVDWMAMDCYNKAATSDTVANVVGVPYGLMAAINSTKPISLCEVGSEFYSSGKSQAQWITDLLTELPANYPRIKHISWYQSNSGSSTDGSGGTDTTPIEATSPTPGVYRGTSPGTAAFSTGIAPSYFVGNIVTSTTFPNGGKIPLPTQQGGLLLPAAGKTWFGSSCSGSITIANVEASILNGTRHVDIVHAYRKLDSFDTSAFPGNGDDGASLQTQSDGGRILFFNFAFKIGGVYPNGTSTWADLAAGTYDTHLNTIADKIKAWYATYGRLVFVSWGAESDGHNGVGTSGASDSQFAAAFQHIHNLFVSRGARSACVFVWDMTGYESNVNAWNAQYPGDSCVDWLAYDPYGKVDPATGAPDATAHLSYGEDDSDAGIDDTGLFRFYKWANGQGAKDSGTGLTYTKAGSHTMPIMVAETGLSYNAGADAAFLAQYRTWWSDLAALFSSGRYPQVRAYVFFPSINSYDPRLDVGSGSVASPQAGSILANFRTLAGLSRLN